MDDLSNYMEYKSTNFIILFNNFEYGLYNNNIIILRFYIEY